jgi:manganese oxidase
MMVARRTILKAIGLGGAALGAMQTASAQTHAHGPKATVPIATVTPPRPKRFLDGTQRLAVTTLNNRSLGYELKDGVKEFRLVCEEVRHEFAPGMVVKAWGYNGTAPGPTIEAIEGDRVRILVTNRLPERTSVHWHGILLPSGMDGVGGLSAPHIQPGETYAYEFTLRQHGTNMYHPHGDEMLQQAVGAMGLFIIHPKDPEIGKVDRDFAILLHAWAVHPGTSRPDPAVMLEHDMWTMNGKAFPAIEHMVVRTGERVRLRIGNLSMHEHPMHIHGHHMTVVGTDAGTVPESARWPETSVQVPVGTTRTIEFVADNPGDWAFHCHKPHHTMNQMGHDIPNMLGVSQKGVAGRISKLLPGYMPMGETGMSEMSDMEMQGPKNVLPMMTGTGPFGPLEMGGMFTVIKVRDELAADYADPGWYKAPTGTTAWRVKA